MALPGRAMAGAMGGMLATGAMTLVMTAAQQAGLMGKMPPRKITEALLTRRKSKPVSALAHLGFGALAGAGYGALAQRRLPLPAAGARGALYGTLVWLTSYAGWIPALGIMPPPSRDRPGRQATMVLAHLVYGAVLGALVRRA